MKKIDLNKINTFALKDRPSKVQENAFAKKLKKPIQFEVFIDSLPDILASKNLKNLVKLILNAKSKKKPVIFTFGAHLVKCGLSPMIIDLVEKGFITCLATNGASCVHDFELSLCGKTSEDVAERLKDGSFGMTKETGEFLNNVAKKAFKQKLGLGQVLGSQIENNNLPFKSLSIFANANKHKIPITVHVAIGTDIIYQHPDCDGAAWGDASYKDFLTFAENVADLGEGGVLLNFGSAVILPEVFLKALTICRNLGYKVFDFTTANFDMIRQYRPAQNIVLRPNLQAGQGYDFCGHHEIMLPLLYASLINR